MAESQPRVAIVLHDGQTGNRAGRAGLSQDVGRTMRGGAVAVVREWTDEAVCRAAAAWIWVPDDAEVVGIDYRLVNFPRWLGIGAIASSFDSNRPGPVLLEEVLEQARVWGQPSVGWWMTTVTRPAQLRPALVACGADHEDTVDVLGLDLTGVSPDFGPLDRISAERVCTYEQHREVDRIYVSLGQPPATQERIEAALAREAEGTEFRVLGRLEGAPVSTGACQVVDGIARLSGAVTIESARGRGAYRAVLVERLRIARELGASMALVKGRVTTSGPILTRVGFRRCGQEWLYRLPIENRAD